MSATALNTKALATAQAEAALAGAMLIPTDNDDGRPVLVLTREAVTVSVEDLTQARRVLATLCQGKGVGHAT